MRVPTKDRHFERMEHAAWVKKRRAENRCICLTCWVAHIRITGGPLAAPEEPS